LPLRVWPKKTSTLWAIFRHPPFDFFASSELCNRAENFWDYFASLAKNNHVVKKHAFALDY
jgi:hypothetical protein